VVVVLLCLSYNYFTFFYFLAIKGFPNGGWLLIEICVELLLLFDFLMNLMIL